MDSWPELEHAIKQRELHNQQVRVAFDAGRNAAIFEREALERAALLERLAPWRRLDLKLRELAGEWGRPVHVLLQQFCTAYWKLDPEDMDRLHLTFMLTSAGPLTPPELTWEASKSSMFGPAWFIIKLKVDQDGQPARFELTVKNWQQIVSVVGLEPLKAALIQAFAIGPYFDRDRKPKNEPGIPFAV